MYLKYIQMNKGDTTLRIDVETMTQLEQLCTLETRNKIDELRFLIKARIKTLGVKVK